MRGRGVSTALAREVLNFLSDHKWMDVRCPVTREYVKQNAYAQYVRQMVNPGTVIRRSKTSSF